MQASGCEGFGGARVGSSSRIVRVLGRLAAFAARLSDTLGRSARNRRVLHRLSSMTDRELKDVGLWRQDVLDAGLAENGDVAQFLIVRRDARRAVRDAYRRGWRDDAGR